jgi:NADH-quinone oxidoreductase subunit L
MAIVLILLAVGSVLAGYVGVPAVLGGGNRIEHFLAPSFEVPGGAHEQATLPHESEAPTLGERPIAGESKGEPHSAGPHEPSESGDHGTELGLMAFSSGIAVAGIGIAAYFFLRTREAAGRVAARFAGAHRVLLNKYYVDELYDATIIQPIKRTSEGLLWKGMDAGLVDGTVNGVGATVRGSAALLRLLQTGSVRAYAASIFVGVLLILAYYLVR